MAEVFDQAALRHFRDAELLEKHSRLANADQLYGLSAECAIKSAWSVKLGCNGLLEYLSPKRRNGWQVGKRIKYRGSCNMSCEVFFDGIFYPTRRDQFNIPEMFLVACGIKRHGGVKPPRSSF